MPSEMPGFSLDASPNLRTTLADRSLSAIRGRPGAPSRLPNGATVHANGSFVPAYSKVSENLSPVTIGNKMVERVINMQKRVPPKQVDKHSSPSNLSRKSTSPDSSGLLSKKSLDIAIRHMVLQGLVRNLVSAVMTKMEIQYGIGSERGARSPVEVHAR
ncbi:hypothetical protein GQ457_03G030090 [Hibiscus cannabinus]